MEKEKEKKIVLADGTEFASFDGVFWQLPISGERIAEGVAALVAEVERTKNGWLKAERDLDCYRQTAPGHDFHPERIDKGAHATIVREKEKENG